jgi:hypothetical protein
MLSARRHRRVTLLALAAYLSATTVGGLLHEHGAAVTISHLSGACGHLADEHRAGSIDHGCDDHAGSDHSLEKVAVASNRGATHSDDCTLCRFVGHRSLSVESPSLDASWDVSRELPPILAVRPSSPIARTTHSRAPPMVG